jgi:nucleoside-diphosphate-sugar epimerase
LKDWYSLAKTEAEEVALKFGEKNGLHVTTLLPSLVCGPLLQHVAVNTTSKVLLYIIKGSTPDQVHIFSCRICFFSSITKIYCHFGQLMHITVMTIETRDYCFLCLLTLLEVCVWARACVNFRK